MLRALWFFALAAGALSAQSGAAVEGKVISTVDGSPVRKAAILLRAAAADRDSYATETDAAGHFAFAAVVPGPYQCEAARTGFEDHAFNRHPRVAHLNLAEGQHVDNVVLRLTPLGVISGQVMDPEGQPVAGAVVTANLNGTVAIGQNTPARAVSDDRGEYRLPGLYPGSYYVLANPLAEDATGAYSSFGPQGVNRNYLRTIPPPIPVRGPAQSPLASTYYPSALEFSQARAIEVTAGKETTSVTVHVQRRALYSVRGKLPGGSPAPILARNRTEGAAHVAGARFYKDGAFEVSGLPSGSYILTRMPGPAQQGGTFARAYVDIADHDVENVEFVPLGGARLAGTVKVTGRTRVAMSSVEIRLEPVAGPGFLTPAWIPKVDGTFELGSIEPEVYRIGIGHPNVIRDPPQPPTPVYITSVKLGDADLPDGALDLRHGSSEKLTISVSGDVGNLDGMVIGDDGQPLPQAAVTLIPDTTKWDWRDRYRDVEADGTGHFVIDKVVPGKYKLFAWVDVAAGSAQSADFRKPYDKFAVEVLIEPNARQTLQLKAIDTEKK
jgi:protocatechuate 3,4-dioxygenase beta subunit